jgi:YidC/Oxa1 family membrane protein insertase
MGIAKRNFWWGKSTTTPPIKPAESTELIQQVTEKAVESPMIDSAIGTTLIDEAAQKLTTISQWGDFKTLGLASAYTPTGWVEQLVELTHISLGLPWWGTIIASTVAFRLLILPMAIKGQRASAKLVKVKPQLQPLEADMAKARKINDPIAIRSAGLKIQELFRKEKINPFSSLFFNLGQMPLFIAGFLAFKKLGELPVPGLQNGGFGWVTDLSVADPYYILPIISSIANLLSFEVI